MMEETKKAIELNKEITAMNAETKDDSAITGQDTNLMIFQMFTKLLDESKAQTLAMQQQLASQLGSQMQESKAQSQAMTTQTDAQSQAMASRMEAQSQAMEAIAEKISANPGAGNNVGGGNKSHAKGRHPDKLERDVDYASFLQWEKSWKLYVISDRLDTLPDKEKTAIFFSFFSKELLSDLEYRFKVNIDAEQKVEYVIEAMKTYLKGQRSIILARYSLFTRRQQYGETFEDWYCELRRLYDLSEAEGMTGDDLLTVLITTGVKDEKVRSKILEDLKTPTLDETVKLIEQMVYAKDTNVRINVLVFGQNIYCILLDKYTLGKGNKW